MIKHSILIVLSISVLSLALFRPYMPGDYDSFATGLSMITQLASLASLMLVPIGACWWSLDRIQERRNAQAGHRIAFRRAALGVSGIITVVAAIGALGTQNISIAVFILALGIYTIIRFIITLKRLRVQVVAAFSPMPYYLIFIPLATFLIQINYLRAAKVHSTNSAIQQSRQLILDIEAYKKANDHFPKSLESTIDDYRPSIAGISNFHYEANGLGYNVYFEQFSDRFGTQEIVMYNALGEHEMTVHNQDLLRERPEQIIRGYYDVQVLTNPQWKIFLFD